MLLAIQSLVIGLLVFLTQTCDSRPRSKDGDVQTRNLDNIPNEKSINYGSSDVNYKKYQRSQHGVNTNGDRQPKRTFTKAEIDTKNIDPNSDLESLLEGMNDNSRKAFGIHPELKANVKAFKLEEQHLDKQNHKEKRNFVPQFEVLDRYWPNATMPFFLNLEIFQNKEMVSQVFKEAIQDFEDKSCVKLERKTEEELKEEEVQYYVNISNSADGCYSELGRSCNIENGQTLNLQENGCMIKSTVIHEFCHALGMHHEQARSDRDEHLVYVSDNIRQDIDQINLEKATTLDRNPYDYYSVMQYDIYSVSAKSWEQAMDFRDPDLEFLAGKAPGLSFYDVMDITKGYNCTEGCDVDLPCTNGGFMNHKCECYCPEGLTGKYCDEIASDDCGGIINLIAGKDVEITSPNYPDNYEAGKTCYWLLKAENKNQRVMIEVHDFNLPSNEELRRCYHFLEIRYNLIGQPGPKFCDDKFYRNKISTTKFGNPDLMMLIFDSETVPDVHPTSGFRIKAQAIEITSKGCKDKPPSVPNTSNNFEDIGSTIDSIVIYECNYLFQMVGSSSITCEADGTWSNIRFKCIERDPVFKCDFENGDCKIERKGDVTNKWEVRKEETKDGINSYFGVAPVKTSKKGFIAFVFPPLLEAERSYCLSFRFRRTTNSEHCASLRIQDAYRVRWFYLECKKMEWTLFQGDYGPYNDSQNKRQKMAIIAYIGGEEGGEFNFEIDDIILSEGTC